MTNKKTNTLIPALPPKSPLSAKNYCLEFDLADFASVKIVGVDEVGRGPLVGDVVAAAVILPDDHGIEGLKDSKKIPEKKREALSLLIQEKAIWAIGRATPSEIDDINILQASLLAMTRAVENLKSSADFALVDGNKLPKLSIPAQSVVKGDSWVQEISAASIIAKVARDQDMYQLDSEFPAYGFAQHKGYPTALHREMLETHGLLKQHRRSFGPVKKLLNTDSPQSEEQK